MSTNKYPIASLPLPPPSDRLTANLLADPATPNVLAFQSDVLREHPSLQRRARIVSSSTHFSYTTPLPLPFPYRIPAAPDSEDKEATADRIERWLGKYEPLLEQPSAPASLAAPDVAHADNGLKKYSSNSNEYIQRRDLVALSKSSLDDCLPTLDTGDAFRILGKPSLLRDISAPNEETTAVQIEQEQLARQELVDVLSGHSVLMTPPLDSEAPKPTGNHFAPWALRYSGHQFGTWAGQLGDGRAITILETVHPKDPNKSLEIQLKGAGRTPYSRSADGLAVLRSSIREFLGAEAIHALGIPTSRSLSLISLPDIPVSRERVETSAVVARIAPSFLRIGSFEALNPPETSTVIYLFSPGVNEKKDLDWEALRVLGEWVSRRVLFLQRQPEEPWGKALVFEVARRNALMVAGWQAYGFMHGVINTDNVSIMGLTIDYGPYAFMDVYDYGHICNHTDEEGRYAFRLQPTMILYAVRQLLRTLAPLIGAEEVSGHAVSPNWAQNATNEQLKLWRERAEEYSSAVESEVLRTFSVHYWSLMRKRLGLKKEDPEDQDLIQGLLDLLQAHDVDYHSTFRKLCYFRLSMLSEGSDALEPFIARLNEYIPAGQQETARTVWREWLVKYGARVEKFKSEWVSDPSIDWEDVREAYMKAFNPRFVLRQWVLEEVIKICESEDLARSRAVLNKVVEMVSNPYREWGAEGRETDLTEEEKEERRLCSLGVEDMLGFQCSCSS